MALVHEIAVNPSFTVDNSVSTSGDSLHERVKVEMHRAFWNALADDLRQQPPNYENAFALLIEIREVLSDTYRM